jgi:hypothetical protein
MHCPREKKMEHNDMVIAEILTFNKPMHITEGETLKFQKTAVTADTDICVM